MNSLWKPFVLAAMLIILSSVSLAAETDKPKQKNPGPEDPALTLHKSPGQKGILTLKEVLSKVLLHNPELKAYSLEIRAREARALQAGLYKNPGILFDLQDVFGSGDFKNIRQSQSTIVLSQIIELGGKRAKREKEALSQKELAFWDYETARMNILTLATQAYIDALVAQEKLKMARQMVKLSQNSYNAVKARVTAGKVSPIQEVRAQVALSTTRIQLQQAKNNLRAAYRRLASFWGEMNPMFRHVAGDPYRIAPVPGYETLAAGIKNNPDLARWGAEIVQRDAAVDLEEAKAIPNLRVGAGGRWFEETHDNSWVVELSIPIPLFDRNQGSIAEARHRRAKAKEQKRAVELKLNAALSGGYARLANAHSRVLSLKTKVLPGARKAFNAVNEGYRFGKFNYLDVLDSQRTWFNARSQYLDALAEYHKSVAEVERLTGQAVTPPPGKIRSSGTEREKER